IEKTFLNRFLYFSHREESEEKLEKIRSLGFEVVTHRFPIDMHFLLNGAPSGEYYSFYSTAVLELHKTIEGADFYSIKPRTKNFWPRKNSDAIDSCYRQIELQGVNMIFLESLT